MRQGVVLIFVHATVLMWDRVCFWCVSYFEPGSSSYVGQGVSLMLGQARVILWVRMCPWFGSGSSSYVKQGVSLISAQSRVLKRVRMEKIVRERETSENNPHFVCKREWGMLVLFCGLVWELAFFMIAFRLVHRVGAELPSGRSTECC